MVNLSLVFQHHSYLHSYLHLHLHLHLGMVIPQMMVQEHQKTCEVVVVEEGVDDDYYSFCWIIQGYLVNFELEIMVNVGVVNADMANVGNDESVENGIVGIVVKTVLVKVEVLDLKLN